MEFNDTFRVRTFNLALTIIRLYKLFKDREETRVIGKQVLRSSTSVAANFRAACHARSDAEYYSKICIVVEECDETLFWLELLEASELVKPPQIDNIKIELKALLSVFAKTKKTLRGNKNK